MYKDTHKDNAMTPNSEEMFKRLEDITRRVGGVDNLADILGYKRDQVYWWWRRREIPAGTRLRLLYAFPYDFTLEYFCVVDGALQKVEKYTRIMLEERIRNENFDESAIKTGTDIRYMPRMSWEDLRKARENKAKRRPKPKTTKKAKKK
jgi:hypothetical protein